MDPCEKAYNDFMQFISISNIILTVLLVLQSLFYLVSFLM